MPASPVAAFISYSHADERLFRRLLDHLSVVVQQGTLAAWHDRWSSQLFVDSSLTCPAIFGPAEA